MKRIFFFGIYDREYPRNKVMLQGLIENGFEVVHCNVNPKEVRGFKKYWLLGKKALALKKNNKFELIWIAFPGHTCVWLAKLIFPKSRLVFDIFISQYEANVLDRKVHKRMSLAGLKDRFLDWYSVKIPNIVILDTNQQIKLFVQKYGLKEERAVRVFLSSALPPDPQPMQSRGKSCLVHFHGSFIPLHGVEFIIRAAKLLAEEPSITFRLVGGGQQLGDMKVLAQNLGLTNLEFTGRLAEYEEVLSYLKHSDVMLGMFAPSGRGHLVIPNKIFEGMVFGKPIITVDTPATRELLTDGVDVCFVKPGSVEDLAAKIKLLAEDPSLRKKLGDGALETFRSKLMPKTLIKELLEEINKRR